MHETTPAAGAAHVASTAELCALLEGRGLRATAQRLRIAELLLASPTHMTAEQILAALRLGRARVSKATVYNTLHLFTEHGLARPIHLEPGCCVYDSTMRPHHHIRHLDTGEVIDVEPGELEFARLPALPAGSEIAGIDVVIRVRRAGPTAEGGGGA